MAQVQATKASPCWTPNGKAYWYRQEPSPGKFEFIFVDNANKKPRPAFDHQKLAMALKQQAVLSQLDFGQHSLPFTSIEPAPDGSMFRFACGGKQWIFDNSSTLREWKGHKHCQTKNFILSDRNSPKTNKKVELTIVNDTNSTLIKYWIDWDGNLKSYGTIAPGQASATPTYDGHVWKLVTEGQKQVLGIYVTPSQGPVTAIVHECTMADVAWQNDG
ncbi:hypothetical protein B0I35DRAFT_427614 [Stachybotrys elegans]|uniref:von Hippel-Lindau disease tumour suppressor beta domain-containing protein n=1 Tax=Stachybotrys elegans TaxID=80388 RepID=A0A8K0SPJ5_9HYPO|nr:hypothetical protein B0I35DRAFT_427614 [Stachybotrys elegans]